jgi:hypothetical protein
VVATTGPFLIVGIVREDADTRRFCSGRLQAGARDARARSGLSAALAVFVLCVLGGFSALSAFNLLLFATHIKDLLQRTQRDAEFTEKAGFVGQALLPVQGYGGGRFCSGRSGVIGPGRLCWGSRPQLDNAAVLVIPGGHKLSTFQARVETRAVPRRKLHPRETVSC